MRDFELSAVTLRIERSSDAAAIRAVADGAFGGPVVGVLIDSLRESRAWDAGLSFVAEHAGRLVGHIMYTHNYLDARR